MDVVEKTVTGMAEYIDREAAIKIAESYVLKNGSALGWNRGIADCIAEAISIIPSADVAPVVHGRWIEKWGLYDKGFYISRKVWYECSHCGMKTNYRDECFEKEVDYNYCPNCGAKMDGGED